MKSLTPLRGGWCLSKSGNVILSTIAGTGLVQMTHGIVPFIGGSLVVFVVIQSENCLGALRDVIADEVGKFSTQTCIHTSRLSGSSSRHSSDAGS